MRIRKGLLLWNLRELRNVTLVAAPIAVGYTAFAPDYLTPNQPWPPAFILGHSIAIAVCLGRFRTGQFGHLYSRGYGRDTLWAHAMLASLIGALAVWLATSLTLWLGLRSFVQDLLESPYYPWIMESQDARVPWTWLVFYTVAIPFVHYAWIREGNAGTGRNAGKVLLAGVAVVSFYVLQYTYHPPGVGLVLLVVAVGCAPVILAGSRLGHRQLEVEG